MPIPRTDAELIAQGVTLLARLGRHLDALEGGDPTAGDDLAAVLRILIANGPGNRAMVRLAAAAGLTLQRVWVSGRPDTMPDPHLLLAFGNLPLTPDRQQSAGQPQEPHWMGFRDWVEAPSLIVPSSQRRKESWGSFAELAGNTTGAHMSVVYHDLLVTSDMFESGGLSLQNYLLRQIGWQVEQSLAELLGQARQSVTPSTRRQDHWPRQLVWAWFKDEVGVGHEMMFGIDVTSDDGPPVEVMRYKIRDRTSRIVHGGGKVSVESDKVSGGVLKVWSGP